MERPDSVQGEPVFLAPVKELVNRPVRKPAGYSGSGWLT
jgi:hypothetical protein